MLQKGRLSFGCQSLVLPAEGYMSKDSNLGSERTSQVGLVGTIEEEGLAAPSARSLMLFDPEEA